MLPDEATNGNVLRHRVNELKTEYEKLEKKCDDLEERLREVENTQGRILERTTVFQLSQGAFTTIAATVAAIWGRMG